MVIDLLRFSGHWSWGSPGALLWNTAPCLKCACSQGFSHGQPQVQRDHFCGRTVKCLSPKMDHLEYHPQVHHLLAKFIVWTPAQITNDVLGNVVLCQGGSSFPRELLSKPIIMYCFLWQPWDRSEGKDAGFMYKEKLRTSILKIRSLSSSTLS